jgi:hypothetical protein
MYSGRNEHPQTVYEFICGQLLDVGDGFISWDGPNSSSSGLNRYRTWKNQ